MLTPPTALSAPKIVTLEACSLHGPHPRQRRRALAVLGHHRGQALPQLARLFAVRYATVHGWLRAWQQHGLAGLAEGRRPGRPPKLAEAAKKSGRLARAGHPAAAHAAAAGAAGTGRGLEYQ